MLCTYWQTNGGRCDVLGFQFLRRKLGVSGGIRMNDQTLHIGYIDQKREDFERIDELPGCFLTTLHLESKDAGCTIGEVSLIERMVGMIRQVEAKCQPVYGNPECDKLVSSFRRWPWLIGTIDLFCYIVFGLSEKWFLGQPSIILGDFTAVSLFLLWLLYVGLWKTLIAILLFMLFMLASSHSMLVTLKEMTGWTVYLFLGCIWIVFILPNPKDGVVMT